MKDVFANDDAAPNGHAVGRVYLEGHIHFVSRLITPISHIITPVIAIRRLLTKSP